MNILTLVVMTLFVLLFAAFTVLLSIAIAFNIKASVRYREALAAKVKELRLGKMLAALGVDIDIYLHNERVLDIHQHMERCRACKNTDSCDESLSTVELDASAIGFCNNEKSLQEMVERSSNSNPSANQ